MGCADIVFKKGKKKRKNPTTSLASHWTNSMMGKLWKSDILALSPAPGGLVVPGMPEQHRAAQAAG